MEQLRMTACYVDIDQLDRNLEAYRNYVGRELETLVVLKADAYGHGATKLMKHFLGKGISYFAVAALNEAMELRRTIKDGNILILGYTPDSLLHYCAENDIIQSVWSFEQAKILSDCGKNARIHIKVDTGMNRLGFAPDEQSADEVLRISKLPSLQMEGVFSHMAQLNDETDAEQHRNFQHFLDLCAERGVTFKLRHLCNGKGAVKHPEMRYDMARVGSVVYGFCIGQEDKVKAIPAMRVETVVARVHKVPAGEGLGYDLLDPVPYERMIATLPFGYADGIPKSLSNHVGWVMIHGQKAEFAGNFCMDMCMADVTHIKDVKAGDRVTVYGGDGMDFYKVRELTGVGLSNLQIIVNKRVPRIYIENGRVSDCVDALLLEE